MIHVGTPDPPIHCSDLFDTTLQVSLYWWKGLVTLSTPGLLCYCTSSGLGPTVGLCRHFITGHLVFAKPSVNHKALSNTLSHLIPTTPLWEEAGIIISISETWRKWSGTFLLALLSRNQHSPHYTLTASPFHSRFLSGHCPVFLPTFLFINGETDAKDGYVKCWR